MRVVVLGAGVVGVTSAWFLARAGHEVTVVDRQPAAAQETSFANGGQISVSHAEPWANPSAPWKALHWLGHEDAPLLFRLRADPALFRWSLRFLRECSAARTRANIRAIVSLALDSRQRLKALRSELAAQGGLAYDHQERGILHFYTDRREFDGAVRAAAVMREYGCDRQLQTAEQCVAIEPALVNVRQQLVGGDYVADDESGDAMKFTQALAAHCQRLGVNFRYGNLIDALRLQDGRAVAVVAGREVPADAVVVALGSWSPKFLAPLGIDIPVYPAKGYSATLQLAPGSEAPRVSLTDDQYKIVISRLGDRLRIAGTAEFNGYNQDLNLVRCQTLVRRVRSIFPQLKTLGAPEFWCGLRPATPSNVPLIGRSAIPNLYINTGHGTLGWTLACGSGAALAELVSGRTPDPDFPFLQ